MQIMPTISPALLPSVLSAENRHPATMGGLPEKDKLVFLCKVVGGVLQPDSIGLSIEELYPLVDPALQPVFSADGGQIKRTDAEIVALVLASPLLNIDTMIANAAGTIIVIYAYDTPIATLRKAYKYLGLRYDTDFAGNSLIGAPDIGAYEYQG